MEFKTCEIEYRDIDADERVIIRANPFVVYKMMPLLQPFFEEGEVIRLQHRTPCRDIETFIEMIHEIVRPCKWWTPPKNLPHVFKVLEFADFVGYPFVKDIVSHIVSTVEDDLFDMLWSYRRESEAESIMRAAFSLNPTSSCFSMLSDALVKRTRTVVTYALKNDMRASDMVVFHYRWCLIDAKLFRLPTTTALSYGMNHRLPEFSDTIGRMIESRPDDAFLSSFFHPIVPEFHQYCMKRYKKISPPMAPRKLLFSEKTYLELMNGEHPDMWHQDLNLSYREDFATGHFHFATLLNNIDEKKSTFIHSLVIAKIPISSQEFISVTLSPDARNLTFRAHHVFYQLLPPSAPKSLTGRLFLGILYKDDIGLMRDAGTFSMLFQDTPPMPFHIAVPAAVDLSRHSPIVIVSGSLEVLRLGREDHEIFSSDDEAEAPMDAGHDIQVPETDDETEDVAEDDTDDIEDAESDENQAP